MRSERTLAPLPAIVVALAFIGGAAALTPDRTIVTSLPVQDLALTDRWVAYVADAPVRLHCARIALWNTATNKRQLLDAKEQCLEQGSTGQGVWDVAVASKRLLWLTYAGGNFREWSLWTATTTRSTPRRLRFVARDVDDPAPIVIGPGTAEGIAYAVDRQVTYLGDDGKAIFTWTAPRPIRAVATGDGPRKWRVAALQDNGTVVVLDASGNPVYDPSFQSELVRSVRLAPSGLVVQMGQLAIISKPSLEHEVIRLPSGARLVDVAQGRLVYQRGRDLWALTIETRKSARLVEGTPSQPAQGQLDAKGIVWAKGRTVSWRAGALP